MTLTAQSPGPPRGKATLPSDLGLGAVHLTVADLDRSAAWYRHALGLHVQEQADSTISLGDGVSTVLVLHGDPRATPVGRHAGLYHVALLFPTREELARAALRLAVTRTPIQGASHHGTHEAIYLPDPDGLGIELAADLPREAWPAPEVQLARGGPEPLDFNSLTAMVQGQPASPAVGPGLRTGHVHLHVGDIGQGLVFYRDIIGFELQAELPTAAFVSAGGYHHHLAFNLWRGRGVRPAPARGIGLHHWTVALPAGADVAQVRSRVEAAGIAITDADGGFSVRDPWDIPVRFEVAP